VADAGEAGIGAGSRTAKTPGGARFNLDIMLELYNLSIVMAWEVEYTDEFEAWWTDLTEEEQESIDAAVEILEERGPALGRPLVDVVRQSRHQHMKELHRPRRSGSCSPSIRRGWRFS